MPGSNGKLIWYELMTTDADAARAFYSEVVGWTIGEGQGDSGYAMIGMPDGMVGGLLPLTQAMRDHGASPAWLMYVAVDDVDATAAAIEQAGGHILMPAWDIPQGRVAMVADPQGAPFYVMTPIAPEGGGASASFSSTLPGRCTWNELRTTDLESALGFYDRHFGWAVSGSMPMGPMGDYMFLTHGDDRIGGAMGSGGQPAKWTHYFRVADIDAAVAAIEAGGGTVLNGPHEVPGGDRVVIASDPQGARVGFVAQD